MTRPKLTVEKRTVLGRKVKNLRREGILPASLYGQGVESQALQLARQDFVKLFKRTGESGLIDLVVGQSKAIHPVLVGNIQLDPVTDDILHVDFRQVDLTKKTVVTVSINLVGEAPGAEGGEGVLIQPLLEVEVEALPTDLPDHLEIDISSLKAVNDVVRVTDIKVDPKVTIKADENEVVAKIEAPQKEEVPEVVEEGAAEETAGSQGGEVSGGEKSPEENNRETSKETAEEKEE